MKHLIALMSVCLCLFSACDYFLPDDDLADQGIVLTNERGLSGTYIVTGPHSFWEKTTKWLAFPPQGEYKVFFTNLAVDGNICSIVDNTPVFIGEASFDVTPPHKKSISVPIREISCKLSFKQEDGTKISKILVSGVPSSIYIDGEFGKPTSLQLSGADCYVIASLMEVSVCIINGSEEAQDMNVLKTPINAEPGGRYTIKVGRDNISVLSD